MTEIDEAFVRANLSAFDNFWQRQFDAAIFERRYPAYGYTVQLQTNDAAVLDSAALSAPRYCRATPLPGEPLIQLHVVVAPSLPNDPPPRDELMPLHTLSSGDYMLQAATPWVQGFADLRVRVAYMFISRALAEERRWVSRHILDRFTNNSALREGLGQLHATTLVKGERALIFVAPHGTGKSTTAFHLLHAGYQLMGDALAFIRARGDALELMAYPSGEGKLTAAMRPFFPEWSGHGEEVTVHGVRKAIVNLREAAPEKIIEHSIYPAEVVICLAQRNDATVTHAEPLDTETTLQQILPETLLLDEVSEMARSLDVVRRLIERAKCFRLTLGADPREIVRVIDNL